MGSGSPDITVPGLRLFLVLGLPPSHLLEVVISLLWGDHLHSGPHPWRQLWVGFSPWMVVSDRQMNEYESPP